MVPWAIERAGPSAPGRSSATAYGPFVWAVATAPDRTQGIEAQTQIVLQRLDGSLAELKTDRTRLLSVQVFLADIAEKDAMDAVWRKWIGQNVTQWPQRACVGADLSPGVRVEIVVLAAR